MYSDLITVVVPIYKVEKFLQRCVNSIINQTYKNIEIILVDDGSPDKCGIMCDEYARIDPRIKVIHKENGGLSDARNVGTNLAIGKYITYIDSDDWISEDYLEVLFNIIQKTEADISIFPLHYVYEKDGENIVKDLKSDYIENVKIFDNKKAIENMLYQKIFDCSTPGKLYKTSLMKMFKFPKGKLYEDLSTTYKVFYNASKVAFLYSEKYFYWQNYESIMYQKFNKRTFDAVFAIDEIELFIKSNLPEVLPAVMSKKFSNYCFVLKKMPLDSSDKEVSNMQISIWNFIKSYRLKMLLDSKARIKNKIAALLSFLGIKFFKFICSRI